MSERQKLLPELKNRAFTTAKEDQAQMDELVFRQLKECRKLERRSEKLETIFQARRQMLERDIHQFKDIQKGPP